MVWCTLSFLGFIYQPSGSPASIIQPSSIRPACREEEEEVEEEVEEATHLHDVYVLGGEDALLGHVPQGVQSVGAVPEVQVQVQVQV